MKNKKSDLNNYFELLIERNYTSIDLLEILKVLTFSNCSKTEEDDNLSSCCLKKNCIRI